MTKRVMLSVAILLIATAAYSRTEQKPKDTLIIAISTDFQPFTFLSAEGKPAGMFVDIWRLWAQKIGKEIEFISSDWSTSLENLKNQKADIHSGLFYSPERFEWMGDSQPFYEVGVSLFYPLKQGTIADLKELSGQTIAAVRGSHQEVSLQKITPAIRILPCDTREELVRVSREGKTSGFIAVSPVGKSVIDRMGLSGEFESYDGVLKREKFHPGVLKNNTELLALVDKGFSATSDQELAEIEARWIPDPAKRYFKTSKMVRLTAAEEAWIEGHKTIRVGMAPIFPPLKFAENGVIKGIEPDYLGLLSEYTGIQFEYVVCDLSLMDAKVKSGDIDMFISFFIPERLAYMSFTTPLMEFNQIIIARNDAPFMSGISALKGKRVATVTGVRLYDKLLSPYPEIEAVPVGTLEEMFKAVSQFKADALISKTFYAGYVMVNYPDLKIAGIADLPPEPYYYAVRKDYPELVGILNQAIASIPKDRFEAIVQKWFSLRLEYHPNWSEILKWAFVIGGVFTLLLGLSFFWNRRLVREIDKRRRTEEALRESEKMLNATGKLAKVGGWEIDADTLQQTWTEEVYRIHEVDLPYSPDVKKGIDFYHPKSRPHIEKAVQRAMDYGEPFHLELRFITAKGNHRWVQIEAEAVQSQGRTLKVFGTFQDITERKRAEEERLGLEQRLHKAQKAESLGRMAGAIAHHFNNQLGVVMGNLELAMLTLPQGAKPRLNIAGAMAASGRAAEISRLMLAYLGQSMGVRAPLELSEVCREALPLLTAALPKNVHLKTEFPAEGPIIRADAGQIRQVLTNLVLNAGEAMGDREGDVTVAVGVKAAADIGASPFYPHEWKPGEESYACLSVADTGCGIDQESMTRLFDPFFSTKFTGRGLGLPVVLGMVKAHQGAVAVESTHGRGTVFRVFLPLAAEQPHPSPRVEADAPEPPGESDAVALRGMILPSLDGMGRGRVATSHVQHPHPASPIEGEELISTALPADHGLVLLVEDDPAMRNMAETMLKVLSCKVITAADGVEAVEAFREHRDQVRCVLLDLTMPRMGGWETLEALRQLSPGIPVILASGYDQASVMEGSHAELPQVFLHKPYSMVELKAALDKIPEKSQ
jgi:PAS domain S-box-containing protein